MTMQNDQGNNGIYTDTNCVKIEDYDMELDYCEWCEKVIDLVEAEAGIGRHHEHCDLCKDCLEREGVPSEDYKVSEHLHYRIENDGICGMDRYEDLDDEGKRIVDYVWNKCTEKAIQKLVEEGLWSEDEDYCESCEKVIDLEAAEAGIGLHHEHCDLCKECLLAGELDYKVSEYLHYRIDEDECGKIFFSGMRYKDLDDQAKAKADYVWRTSKTWIPVDPEKEWQKFLDEAAEMSKEKTGKEMEWEDVPLKTGPDHRTHL